MVKVELEKEGALCRRDLLRECKLVLTPEVGVAQEHVYNFGNCIYIIIPEPYIGEKVSSV
jgi:putative transposon-encoded protein